MKREISLIQAYAYSKLRKEHQIEWDYQKYLWEKERLQMQQILAYEAQCEAYERFEEEFRIAREAPLKFH